MHCTIRVAKTKALISFAVTAKLICAFVFSKAKIQFSHDAAQLEQISHPFAFSVGDFTQCFLFYRFLKRLFLGPKT